MIVAITGGAATADFLAVRPKQAAPLELSSRLRADHKVWNLLSFADRTPEAIRWIGTPSYR